MTTNNNLGIHSYILELPIAMQQSIMLDLVQNGITGEDLVSASRSRLCDLADSINLKPYIIQLGCEVHPERGRAKGRFFISDLAEMNMTTLEGLSTIKYALDVDHCFNMEIYHDVYEYTGKYYMVLLHFYNKDCVLEYDDDSEAVETSVETSVERTSVFFSRNEVTIGLMGQEQFSFGFDNMVTHYLDVHSCAEYDEHMIFAVHKYADIDPKELINKIYTVLQVSLNI